MDATMDSGQRTTGRRRLTHQRINRVGLPQLFLFGLMTFQTAVCVGQQAPPAAPAPATAPAGADRQPSAPVAPGVAPSGDISLPRSAGQAWREYDISHYCKQVGGEAPEQAVVDWVLRETGTQIWFGHPLGILSASKEKLRVYHTPEVHARVAPIVERLVRSRAHMHSISLRLCTISNPNWRSKAMRVLTPVAAQSPGVDAWLLSKEDASTLIGQLKRRMDYHEHNSPQFQIPNGKDQVVTRTRPKSYIRALTPNDLLGADTVRGSIDEGYSLKISPLLSLDQRNMDAVIQCRVDQVEKVVTLPVDMPTNSGLIRRQIEVPQLVSWRLHERFKWPVSQVLLLSCGVVAQPDPTAGQGGVFGLTSKIPLLPKGASAQRADALLFVEVHSQFNRAEAALRAASAAPAQDAGTRSGSRGRY